MDRPSIPWDAVTSGTVIIADGKHPKLGAGKAFTIIADHDGDPFVTYEPHRVIDRVYLELEASQGRLIGFSLPEPEVVEPPPPHEDEDSDDDGLPAGLALAGVTLAVAGIMLAADGLLRTMTRAVASTTPSPSDPARRTR